MRVFLDTNVLVSAVATRGLCADLVRHVLAEHQLITGEVVIAELRRALRDKLRVPEPAIAPLEKLLRDQVVVARPPRPSPLRIPDADDRWILASAIAGNSDVLVTGDSDLLKVASRAPLPIVNPRGCWELLRNPKE